MKIIIECLRGKKLNCKCAARSARECCCGAHWPENYCNVAADALEAQAKRIAELEKALEEK